MSPAKHTNRRFYGWLPDLPDIRDWTYRPPKKRRLPATVDLIHNCSPVEDQGKLGSCTANALSGALEFLEEKDNKHPTDMSRLFIYFNERRLMHTTGQDSGARLRDGIKTLAKDGACDERKWPYDIRNFTKKPSDGCYTDGKKHRITEYARIDSLRAMQLCLASGFPFVFGFTVYASMESRAVAKTGDIPMPKLTERPVGGHAMLAIGYSNSRKCFMIKNSWGISWGTLGYGTIPFEYLENRNLSDDFWTIRAGGGF